MKRNKKLKTLLLSVAVFLSIGVFSLSPKPAHAQFIVGDIWARVRDTIKDFKEHFADVLKEHSALMWKQAQLYFGTKLAKDAAVSLASGNPGQMMMFVTDPKEYWGELANATAGEYLDSLSKNVFGKSLCQPSDINIQIERELGIRRALGSITGQITNLIPNMCEEMCQHLAPTEREITDPITGRKIMIGSSNEDLFNQLDYYNSLAKKLMTQVLDIEKNIARGVGENIWENVRRVVYPYKKIKVSDNGTPLDPDDDIYENLYKNLYCNNPADFYEQYGYALEDYYKAIEAKGNIKYPIEAIEKDLRGQIEDIQGNGVAFGQMLRALFKVESNSEISKIRAFCGFFNDPFLPDFILKIIIQDAWTTKDSKDALGILYLRYAASQPQPMGPLYNLFGAFKANEILIKNKALTAQYVDIWPLLDFLLAGVHVTGQLAEWSPVQYDLDEISKVIQGEYPGRDIKSYLYESTYVPQPNNLDIHSIIDNQIDTDSPIFNLAKELYRLESEIGELDEGFFEALDNYNTCIITCEKGEVKTPKNKCTATDIYNQATQGSGLEKVGITGVNVGLTLDNVRVGDYGNYCEGGSRDWYPCSSDKDCQPGGNCKLRYVKSEDIKKIQSLSVKKCNGGSKDGKTCKSTQDCDGFSCEYIIQQVGGALSGGLANFSQPGAMAEFSSYFAPGNNPIGQLLVAVQESQEKSAGAKAQEEIERQSSGLLPKKSIVSGKRELPPEAGMTRLERNLASLREANNQYTGSVLAQMWGVFANTLIQKLEERLYEKGLNPQTFGGPFEGKPRDSLGTGRAVAEAQFSEFANPEIIIGAKAIPVLATLTSGCEKKDITKRAYNECIINSNWQDAINQKISLKDAVDKNKKGLIPANSIFGFDKDGGEPTLNEGLPYSSMVVLRKYRIIPSSWELAAEYSRYELETGKRATPRTISELMNAFDDPYSPYYKLVDPNWVLKVPEFQCYREGAGEVIISETPEVIQPADDVIPKVVVARQTSCGDERSCIRESDNGQKCEKYGYCIREKNTWHFGTGTCDPLFNTCMTYKPEKPNFDETWSKAPEVHYLNSTLEQASCSQAEAQGCQEYRRDYRVIDGLIPQSVIGQSGLTPGQSGLTPGQSGLTPQLIGGLNYNPRQFKDEFGQNKEFNDTYDFFNDLTTNQDKPADYVSKGFIINKDTSDEKIKTDYQNWLPDPSAFVDNSTLNPDGFLTQVPTLWKCARQDGQSCYFERIAGRQEGCEISSVSANSDSPESLKCTPWLKTQGGKLQRNIDKTGKPLVSIDRVFGVNRYWCGLPGGAGCFVSDEVNIKPIPSNTGTVVNLINPNAGHSTTVARKTCVVLNTKVDQGIFNGPVSVMYAMTDPRDSNGNKPLTCTLGDSLESRVLLNSSAQVFGNDGKLICAENSAGCQEFVALNFKQYKQSVFLSDTDKVKMLGKLLERGKKLSRNSIMENKSYIDIFNDGQFTQASDNLPITKDEFGVESIYLNNKRVPCNETDLSCRKITQENFTFASRINPRKDMCPSDCIGYNSFLALPTALENQLTPEQTGTLNYFVPDKVQDKTCQVEGCETFSKRTGTTAIKSDLHYFNKIALCVIQDPNSPPNNIISKGGQAPIEIYRTIDGTEGFEPKAWKLLKNNLAVDDPPAPQGTLKTPLNAPIKDAFGNNILYSSVKDMIKTPSDLVDDNGILAKQYTVYNGPCVKFNYKQDSDNPDDLICDDQANSSFLKDGLSFCLEYKIKLVDPNNPDGEKYAVAEFKTREPDCREFLYFNDFGEAESYPLPLDRIIRAVDNTLNSDSYYQCKPYNRESTRKAYNLVAADSVICPEQQSGCRRYQGFELAQTDKVFVSDFQNIDGQANFEKWQIEDEFSKLDITQGINVGDQALLFGGTMGREISPEELVYNPTSEISRKEQAGKKYTLSFWVKSVGTSVVNLDIYLQNCLNKDCSQKQESVAVQKETISNSNSGFIRQIGSIVAKDKDGNDFVPNHIKIIASPNPPDGELLIDHIILKQQTDLYLIEPKPNEDWPVPMQCNLNLGRICKAGSSYVSKEQGCDIDGGYCCGPNYSDIDIFNPDDIKTDQDQCFIPEGQDYCELPFTALDDKGTPDESDDKVYVLDTIQEMYNYIGCANYQVDNQNTALTIKNFGELCDLDKIGCMPLINTFNTASSISAVYNEKGGDILGYKPENPSPPKTFVPEDTIEFWAFDKDARCKQEQKSCAYLAKPQVNIDYQVTGFTPLIIKDDPAYYEINQVSSKPGLIYSNLCYLAQNQCRVYDSGAGQVVFKDPGAKYCEFRKGTESQVSEWYKNIVGTGRDLSLSNDLSLRDGDVLCPLQNFTDKQSGIKVSRPQGVCVDTYGAGILKSDGSAYQCDYWVQDRTDLPKEKDVRRNSCIQIIGDNPNIGDCAPISATCPKEQSMCTEIRDPKANGIEKSSFIIKANFEGCTIVDDEAGCKLFADMSQRDSTDYLTVLNMRADQTKKGESGSTECNAANCYNIYADEDSGFKMPQLGEVGYDDPDCHLIDGICPSDNLTKAQDPDCPESKKDKVCPLACKPYWKMCDSNKIIKVQRDRTCGEWLECTSSLQLASDKKTANTIQSEPLCLSRKPCDQWGPDDTCAHFVEDAVNVFSTTQIVEEEYKSPNLNQTIFGGPFNQDLQSRIKTLSGFSKIGMDFVNGQCTKGIHQGKVCWDFNDCFKEDFSEVCDPDKKCTSQTDKPGETCVDSMIYNPFMCFYDKKKLCSFGVCQSGPKKNDQCSTYENCYNDLNEICPQPTNICADWTEYKGQSCENNFNPQRCYNNPNEICGSKEYMTPSYLNAFSSKTELTGRWHYINSDAKAKSTSYPLIQEQGDISMIKNSGFEEVVGLTEVDTSMVIGETSRTTRESPRGSAIKANKSPFRYWQGVCEYDPVNCPEKPGTIEVVSRYERGKSNPNRTVDSGIQGDELDKFLVKEGNISLMLGSNQKVMQKIDGIRSPGKYVLSAWVKNETAKQAGLGVTQYDREGTISAIKGSIHNTTCFQFFKEHEEFESFNDSYDNCLFVDKPTRGWRFVSKLINIEITPKSDQTTIYITVELFNNSSGTVYFDEVQLRPHLQIQGEYQKTYPFSKVTFTGPACRLYAAEDALSCDARDERGAYQRGWRGYCMETKNGQCVNWWPVDMITGEANSIGTIENAGYQGPAPLYYCAESRDKNLPPKIQMPRLVCVAKNKPQDLTYEGCKIIALVSDPKPLFYTLREGDWKLGVDANNFGRDPSETGSSGKFSVKYLKMDKVLKKNDPYMVTDMETETAGLCLVTPQKVFENDNDSYNCIKSCMAVQGLGAWDANTGVKAFWQGKNDGSQAYGGCEWTKDNSNWRECGEDVEEVYHKVVYFAFANKDGNIDVGADEAGCKPHDGADRIYRVVYGDLKYQAFCSSPYCFGKEEAIAKSTLNYQVYDNFYSIYYNDSNALALTNDRAKDGSKTFPIQPRQVPRETRPQQCAVLSQIVDESGDNKAFAYRINTGEFNFAEYPGPLRFGKEDQGKQCDLYESIPFISSPDDIIMNPLNPETYKEMSAIRVPLEMYHLYNPENDDLDQVCKEAHRGEDFYACGGICAVCVGGGIKNHGKFCTTDTDCGGGKCGQSQFTVCQSNPKQSCKEDTDCTGKVQDKCLFYCSTNKSLQCREDKDCLDYDNPENPEKCLNYKYCSQNSRISCQNDKNCNLAEETCIQEPGICKMNPQTKCLTDLACSQVTNDKCISTPSKVCIKGSKNLYQFCVQDIDCGTNGNGECTESLAYIQNEKAFQDPAQGKNRLQQLFAKAYDAFEWVVDKSQDAIDRAIKTGFEVGIYDSSEITKTPNAKWDITNIVSVCKDDKNSQPCAQRAGCQLSACVPEQDQGDYEKCAGKGNDTCIKNCTENSIDQLALKICLNSCYDETTCKDGGDCKYESESVCTPAQNPYPQVKNIAIEQKSKETIEIKAEDDHTVDLTFGITANQNQLPIKEIYIDWGDGEITTLGGISWSADEPNSSALNIRKFLHTYQYYDANTSFLNTDHCKDIKGDDSDETEKICIADPVCKWDTVKKCQAKTYKEIPIDPRDPCNGLDDVKCKANLACKWDSVCKTLFLCSSDNCAFCPRVKVVDNWGWCNGDGKEQNGKKGVIGYYQEPKIIPYPNCYTIDANGAPNINAWNYFEGTVKVFPPKD